MVQKIKITKLKLQETQPSHNSKYKDEQTQDKTS